MSNLDEFPDIDVAACHRIMEHLTEARLALVPLQLRAEQRQRAREHARAAKAKAEAREAAREANRRAQENGPALSREDRLTG